MKFKLLIIQGAEINCRKVYIILWIMFACTYIHSTIICIIHNYEKKHVNIWSILHAIDVSFTVHMIALCVL